MEYRRIHLYYQRMKPILGVASAALLAVSLTGCGGATVETTTPSPSASPTPTKSQIQQALDKCKIASDQSEYASLGDSGYTVTLYGRPEYSQAGLPVTDIACILKAITIPDSVMSEIDSTRALDGTQKDSWDKFQASWTYHPKNGVPIILTESKSCLPN